MNIERTYFKVFYGTASYGQLDDRIELGRATLQNERVRFTSIESAHSFLESQSQGFLRELRANVAKLCKSVGHYGKYFSSHDTETGVCVERQN